MATRRHAGFDPSGARCVHVRSSSALAARGRKYPSARAGVRQTDHPPARRAFFDGVGCGVGGADARFVPAVPRRRHQLRRGVALAAAGASPTLRRGLGVCTGVEGSELGRVGGGDALD